MKRILLTLLLTLALQATWATLEIGHTYRIVLDGAPAHSLFVQNSSFSDKAPVVLWTETDVPSQQWQLRVLYSSGMATMANVYTGKYLSVSNGQVVQSTTPCYWTLKQASGGDEDTYLLTYLTKSLSVNTMADGASLSTTSAPTALDGGVQSNVWRFVEVEEQRTFTPDMRDRMARGFLDHYLQNKGLAMRTFINGGWGESETMEAVLDMYEQTGDEQYWNTYAYCYRYHQTKVGKNWTGGTLAGGYDWFGYDFNDDVMWHIIGAARAAKLTGKKDYLQDARSNFDAIYQRALLGYVPLMRWAEHTGDRNGTNSCINGPTEVAACYIAIASADESYYEKARTLYSYQRRYLFDSTTGQVYDAVVLDPATAQVVSRNTWASTYNQGTMLGAACLLYQHYGDEQYRQDADRIIHYAMRELCDEHGIVRVCQNADGDFQGFKGILMRYAGLYARTFDSQEVNEWLIRNALHAYCNMNSRHYGHSAWLTKAAENDHYGNVDYGTQAFGASTALSAAFSATLAPATDDVSAPQSSCCPAPRGIFDMQGRHLSSLPSHHGVYIVDGRRVLSH